MNKTSIEWTDYTSNLIRYRDPEGRSVHGCIKVSAGCANCYASAWSARGLTGERGGAFTAKRQATLTPYFDDAEAQRILRTRVTGKRVFVGDMTDVFGEWVPDALLDRMFAVFAMRPDLTFQLLTKRPERMRAYLTNSGDNEPLLDGDSHEGRGQVPVQFDRVVQPGAGWQPEGETDSGIPGQGRLGGGQGVLEVHPVGIAGDADRQSASGWGVRNRQNLLPHVRASGVADRVEAVMESISGENGWCSPSPLSNWPLPNVWLGVSVEDQAAADDRIPELLDTPAAVRFLSCEPLLGQLMLRRPIVPGSFPGLHWIIVGGESGPGARPCDVGWIRDIVQQCKAAAVPVFVKQLGSRPVGTKAEAQGGWESSQFADPDARYERHLRDRAGRDMSEWPEDLRVREYPS